MSCSAHDWFAEFKERSMADWEAFLRFDSISAQPEYDQACVDCADWLVSHINKIGLSACIWPTEKKPCVFAEYHAGDDRPTVLFYGHYDVQPVDPLELWDSPPFEPTWRDGRLYARGAEDNKGQVFYVLKALECLIASDELEVNVKVLIEGEEEFGSEGITAALPGWRDKIQADVLMVTDTNMMTGDIPALVKGRRGIIHLTVELDGPNRDLHSGIHGGKALNPAHCMADVLSALHDDAGRIAVDGFYDGVKEPSARDRELANEVGFDPEAYRAATGAEGSGGETMYTQVERIGFRPTLEINGISSGYSGAGMKTIIPSRAQAKLSARLVAGQDPGVCMESIKAYIRRIAHPDVRVRFSEEGIGGPALVLDSESRYVERTRRILEEVTDKKAFLLWEGASIPILTLLADVSGSTPILSGFGSDEGNAHAPNESFSKWQFEQGFHYAYRLFTELGRA